ncbi:hypothetical protein GCM10010116_47380 [Microbispora rosea subsp. aerata]|nr:hypothetical protein GCM10010116_47380 [Microbispora rosea subsp. aerata]GIH57834.1 hypothetical protein Mro02_47480 [Microbispora rosea subsp. aerata]GLJ84449.1 hypothetical protein GCM10017588_31770 [Microbispora rosea subsp. aerata]
MGVTALATAPAYADPAAPSPSPKSDPTPAETARKPYTPNPRILSVDVDPDVVVLRKGRSVQVTARVTTRDVRSIDIDLWRPGGHGGHGGNGWFGKPKSGHHGPKFDHASRSWRFDWNDRTGTYKVHVEAVGLDGKKYHEYRSFTVKREERHWPRPTGPKATRIAGFDATPEPVRKGRTLTLKGTLQVAQCWGDWYYGWNDYSGRRGGDRFCLDNRNFWHDWHWLGSQDVKVYFQPAGSRKWHYVGTTETNGHGHFATKVRAWRSGTWAVRFDGNRRLKGSQATDYVKVRRH